MTTENICETIWLECTCVDYGPCETCGSTQPQIAYYGSLGENGFKRWALCESCAVMIGSALGVRADSLAIHGGRFPAHQLTHVTATDTVRRIRAVLN